MLIRSGPRLNTLTAPPTVSMDGIRVEQVLTTISLGETIDDKLSWNCYIKKLTKKIARGIGAMIRIRHLVPQATLNLIYQALIQPHFDYCSTLWGTCSVTLQKISLKKLQNRAARVLTFLNYNADAGQLLEILGWKNLQLTASGT